MLLKEIAVQLMEHLCNHNWHGYSQLSRYGDGEGTCPVEINGRAYYLEQGDRDCSSAIITAFEAAGISCGGATYTGNMRSCMTGTGNFKWHPMSDGYIAQRGDIYLNEANHTAMCISAVPDMLAEFSISETGGIDGAEGDQTGKESVQTQMGKMLPEMIQEQHTQYRQEIHCQALRSVLTLLIRKSHLTIRLQIQT